MTSKRRVSPRTIEREFFKAFFALLADHDTHLGLEDPLLDARFRRAYRVLAKGAPRSASMRRLLNRLRPDPITGAVTALREHLLRLQPGIVTLPNFRYGHAQVLKGEHGNTALLGECLGTGITARLESAVTAFLAADGSEREDGGVSDAKPHHSPDR